MLLAAGGYHHYHHHHHQVDLASRYVVQRSPQLASHPQRTMPRRPSRRNALKCDVNEMYMNLFSGGRFQLHNYMSPKIPT